LPLLDFLSMTTLMEDRFSAAEKEAIIKAVERAELRTSGEIRVHIEKLCKEDVLDHAAFVFSELKMHQTAERNGVLIYLSLDDHKFAIIGDAGINEKVGQGFWDTTKEAMLALFKSGKIAEGISKGVEMAGEKLSSHFPRKTDDVNELSNEISFGK